MSEDDVAWEPQRVPESHDSGLRRPWIIVLVAAAVVVAAVLGALVLNRGGSSKSPAATLEPAGSAGQNPFADSVAIGTATTFPKDVRAIVAKLRNKLPLSKQTQTLVATGTAPGLFGGNGATRVCDSQALITYLRKNPGNAPLRLPASTAPTTGASGVTGAARLSVTSGATVSPAPTAAPTTAASSVRAPQ